MTATILVTVYKSSKPWHRRAWRWKARNAGNHEVMASGQSYVHEGDAIAAVNQLFGDATDAVLMRDGVEVALRRAL